MAHEVDVLLHGTNSSFSSDLGNFNANGLLKIEIATLPPPASLAKGP